MANELQCSGIPEQDMYVLLFSQDLTKVWDVSTGEMTDYLLEDLEDYKLTTADVTGLGDYAADMPEALAGYYHFVFRSEEDNLVKGEGSILWDGESEVTDLDKLEEISQAVSQEVVWAQVRFTRAQTSSEDKYQVQWLRNSEAITDESLSEITISVYSEDGTELIPTSGMTSVGNGLFLYTAEGNQRQVKGVSYIAVVSTIINEVSYVWRALVGRDSP